ncbi:MAG: rhodanese-like domain-containing protein [Anaerolineae bacterium]|nr:rhodanese-like domain-containing protein [Anaerolineae bacterium]
MKEFRFVQEGNEMRIISREELREKLERGDNFKLYMTLGRQAFAQSHIPGSINLESITEATANMSPDDEIVVYCANPACPASIRAYMKLRQQGCRNVYRYAGGLMEWEAAGYELAGSSNK